MEKAYVHKVEFWIHFSPITCSFIAGDTKVTCNLTQSVTSTLNKQTIQTELHLAYFQPLLLFEI